MASLLQVANLLKASLFPWANKQWASWNTGRWPRWAPRTSSQWWCDKLIQMAIIDGSLSIPRRYCVLRISRAAGTSYNHRNPNTDMQPSSYSGWYSMVRVSSYSSIKLYIYIYIIQKSPWGVDLEFSAKPGDCRLTAVKNQLGIWCMRREASWHNSWICVSIYIYIQNISTLDH